MAAQNATNAAMISLLHKLANMSASPKYSIKIPIFLTVYLTSCSSVAKIYSLPFSPRLCYPFLTGSPPGAE